MFNVTKFYPFEFDYLHGNTNKILPRILISSIFKDISSLGKIITNFAYIINTFMNK